MWPFSLLPWKMIIFPPSPFLWISNLSAGKDSSWLVISIWNLWPLVKKKKIPQILLLQEVSIFQAANFRSPPWLQDNTHFPVHPYLLSQPSFTSSPTYPYQPSMFPTLLHLKRNKTKSLSSPPLKLVFFFSSSTPIYPLCTTAIHGKLWKL